MNDSDHTELTPPAMQVHVARHYSQNRGDHAADVTTAHIYDPNETVEAMLHRVLELPLSSYRSPDPTEFVTLRIVDGTVPQKPSSGLPPF